MADKTIKLHYRPAGYEIKLHWMQLCEISFCRGWLQSSQSIVCGIVRKNAITMIRSNEALALTRRHLATPWRQCVCAILSTQRLHTLTAARHIELSMCIAIASSLDRSLYNYSNWRCHFIATITISPHSLGSDKICFVNAWWRLSCAVLRQPSITRYNVLRASGYNTTMILHLYSGSICWCAWRARLRSADHASPKSR